MSDEKIKVTKDGPYVVSANVPLRAETSVPNKDGIPEKWEDHGEIKSEGECRLCRCGKSKNKPFCDGSHMAGFNGTETAQKIKFDDEAETYEGYGVDLKDCEIYCSSGRFCDKGIGVWQAAENSSDPENKKLAIEEACNCPSGRLVVIDKKTGETIEPKFAPQISVTQDEAADVSGPLWVKGGIEIESADGEKYEKRNRCTICRCGKSSNKPFCDGSHISTRFNDKE